MGDKVCIWAIWMSALNRLQWQVSVNTLLINHYQFKSRKALRKVRSINVSANQSQVSILPVQWHSSVCSCGFQRGGNGRKRNPESDCSPESWETTWRWPQWRSSSSASRRGLVPRFHQTCWSSLLPTWSGQSTHGLSFRWKQVLSE